MSRIPALRGRVPAAIVSLALALMAFPAVAAADHPFLPSYFSPPKEKEGFPVPSPLLPEHALTGYETAKGTFKDTCGLAVDSQGEVYVADYYHDLIDRFGWTLEHGTPFFRYSGATPIPTAVPAAWRWEAAASM